MCLSVITHRYQSNDDIAVVYKIFSKPSSNNYAFPYYLDGKTVKLGDILVNKNRDSILGGTGYYDAGFHCFTTEEGAREYKEAMEFRRNFLLSDDKQYCIVECHAWNITAEGREIGKTCIVAQNIQLMKEIK